MSTNFIRAYPHFLNTNSPVALRKTRYLPLLDSTARYNSVSRLRERLWIIFCGSTTRYQRPRAAPQASQRPNWINRKELPGSGRRDGTAGIGKVSARFPAHVWRLTRISVFHRTGFRHTLFVPRIMDPRLVSYVSTKVLNLTRNSVRRRTIGPNWRRLVC